MTRRVCAALLVLIAVGFVPIRLGAQTSRAKDGAAQWKQLKTSWGDPDFRESGTTSR